jgi:hypothetical protein
MDKHYLDNVVTREIVGENKTSNNYSNNAAPTGLAADDIFFLP